MSEKRLTLAHSPDADDMVMWWPICGMRNADGTPMPGDKGRPVIDCSPIVFEPMAEDVEVLNRRAAEAGDLDITAISARTFADVADRYAITRAGGSFGEAYGPKVVVREDDARFVGAEPMRLTGDDVTIAVPGSRTTAFMVLSLLLEAEDGPPFRFVEMRFDKIIGALQRGEVDAGLLIHEAQLTFEDAGLRLMADLGSWWHDAVGGPLPLGLNVIRRDVAERTGLESLALVGDYLHESVVVARRETARSKTYLNSLADHRSEWSDEALLSRYLDMYVSELTADMGELGVRSLATLFERGAKAKLCPAVKGDLLGLV